MGGIGGFSLASWGQPPHPPTSTKQAQMRAPPSPSRGEGEASSRYTILIDLLLYFILTPCTAATFTATNHETLNQVLIHAHGGDVIKLTPGTYGDLVLAGTDFLQPVIMQSLDTKKPAMFSDILLRSMANLTFDGIAITRALIMKDAHHITVLNSHFSSTKAHAPETKYGVFMLRSHTITLSNNVLRDLPRGIAMSASSAIKITGNEFFAIETQGINGAASSDVEISGNYCHDFIASPHLDMIQFWTGNSIAGSESVTIRDNVFTQPVPAEGQPMQGIAIAFTAQSALRYKHIIIQNNFINENFGTSLLVSHLDESQLLQNTEAFKPNVVTERWHYVRH